MSHVHEPHWPGPVVVGIDGSESALRAVRWAAAEATRHRVGLRILHAIGVPDFFPGGAVSPSTELFHLLENDSSAVLLEAERVAVEAAPTLDVAAKSTTDPPVIALIEASRAARCVVLGGSGRGAFAGLLLGSTTVTLAAHAHCPVVAVRGTVEPEPDAPIVVGVDGSELSDDALGCAFEQAAFRRVRLVAVHAYTDADAKRVFSEARMAHDWEPLSEAEARVLAERLAGWSERYPDVTVERDLVQAKPRQRLLKWSERASLVVAGSRGRGGFSGLLLGSTSQALLHHAECPVMIVRPEPQNH